MSISMSTLCSPKLMWLLKSPLDQKSIIIYHKFNDDYKSHINFGEHKVDIEIDMYHYSG
jgi:hypothetical protein